ncbi:MAG: UDP-N-acetylmuramate dehydrogenase [Acidobacteriaceae bacterium]|nr:UDP-N-acetylmuramate dehydrogenase [Acidobacteriaceae bacterium]
MSFELHENVPLAPLTTFGVGGNARWLAPIRSEEDLLEALNWASSRSIPVFVLGGGSNLLVDDEGFPGLVLHMQITGIEPRSADLFNVGAGVLWDDFVSRVVSAGYAGVECLAGIPGSVGGTPVQNVGAYGQEVSEVIESVRAYDREQGTFVWLSAADCHFRYRESRFNIEEPSRFLVTRVTFRLQPNGQPNLRYADLRRHFGLDGSTAETPLPTVQQVAAAVREIRRSKGMLLVAGDPDVRSAGSFFKNAIVDAALLPQIAAAVGLDTAAVPNWPAGPGLLKLPAAWLLERAGFVKGFGAGPVGISTKHTLAVVNRGHATFADVAAFQQEITAAVQARFGVTLIREPVTMQVVEDRQSSVDGVSTL